MDRPSSSFGGDVSGDQAPHRISQADIGSAADELVRDPDGYFERQRALRTPEAEAVVQRELDQALREQRPHQERGVVHKALARLGRQILSVFTLSGR